MTVDIKILFLGFYTTLLTSSIVVIPLYTFIKASSSIVRYHLSLKLSIISNPSFPSSIILRSSSLGSKISATATLPSNPSPVVFGSNTVGSPET